MKLRYHGYKEETIKNYKMSMGDVKLTIAQGMIENKITDIEIRIVDCFMGTVDSYENLNALLLEDTNCNWFVSVYEMTVMHDNRTEKDFLKVILSDNVEMMDEE